MLRNKKNNICWTVGIPQDQLQTIQKALESVSHVTICDFPDISSLPKIEKAEPFLLITSLEVEQSLCTMLDKSNMDFANCPRALLLPSDYDFNQVIAALDAGVAEILHPPFSHERIYTLIAKALEAKLVHQDIRIMTREILFERELLERKNAILSFIVNFIERVSHTMDYETILRNAFECLSTMIPSKTMHIAFWKEGVNEKKEITLYIDAKDNKDIFEEWKTTLLDELFKQTGPSNYSVEALPLSLGIGESEKPKNSNYISLPIKSGIGKSSVLLMVTEAKTAFGRDQVEALETAMNYLGLVLSNARLYELVKLDSLLDPLTGLYNRRHFEHFINNAMLKFQRDKRPLSFILMDIDHFKKINDTKGHDIGDFVLKEVAKIMKHVLRNTDNCFRYGGEEFTIIMPETNIHEAACTAERLRSAIEAHEFKINDSSLRITVSMGISLLSEDTRKDKEQLVQEADTLMYEAKRMGRNCVKYQSNQERIAVNN